MNRRVSMKLNTTSVYGSAVQRQAKLRHTLQRSNAQVERHAAAVFQPELIDPESSIPSHAQRSYAACPLQWKLGVQMWLFKALGKSLAGLADEYSKLTSWNPHHLNVVLCCH